jgi:hypothetical protein
MISGELKDSGELDTPIRRRHSLVGLSVAGGKAPLLKNDHETL